MAKDSNTKKFKYLDSMLANDNRLLNLDDKLKKLLKPEGKTKALRFTAAADFNRLDESAKESRDELFSNMATMVKVKGDMAKIFGKDDEIYGMKNDKQVAKLEQYMKLKFKTNALYMAFEKENYDDVLKIAGYGGDYSKLKEVADRTIEMGNQLQNEFSSSKNLVENTKVENTIEEVEYDLANEF